VRKDHRPQTKDHRPRTTDHGLRTADRRPKTDAGATLLELLTAAGLAAGVLLIAGTLYVAVLGTERATRELLGSTPEAGVLDLLEDLASCGGAVGPAAQTTAEGVTWWRTEVCVRAYVLDVRPELRVGMYVLRLRSGADVGALRALRALAGEPAGWVRVETAGGCACRADFEVQVDPAELVVGACEGCVPAPGPAEGRPVRPSVLRLHAEVVVVPPGARLPAGAPAEASPQGMSLLFWAEPPGGTSAEGPFPPGAVWLPVYVHLPSPTLAAGLTLQAWGSRYLVAGDPWGPDLVGTDLDGDGDGELTPGEAPARRLVPMSAVEGWVLWTTGFGRLRHAVPERCGPLDIPVGDTRTCRSNAFRPF